MAYEVDVTAGESIHFEVYGERLDQKMDLDVTVRRLDDRLIKRFGDVARPKGTPKKLPLGSRDVSHVWTPQRTERVQLWVYDKLSEKTNAKRSVQYQMVLTKSPDFRVIAMAPTNLPKSGLQVVRPGNARIELYLVKRQNFAQPIHIRTQDLPAGMTAKPVTILPGQVSTVLTVRASKQSEPGVYPIRLVATAKLRNTTTITREVHSAAIVRKGVTRLTDAIVLGVK